MRILNIYIFSAMRGAKSAAPKCIYVIEDDESKQSKAYLRRFSDSMTNNQLALSAVITALSRITEPYEVHLYTDSSYVSGTFADNRLKKWQQQNWINAKGHPVMNRQLWEQMEKLSRRHMLYVEFNNSNSIYLWMKEQIENVDNG